MNIDINSLRSAVKSVLPLVGESYKGNGYGAFVVIDNGLWCTAGSSQSRLGGAYICGLEDGYEDVVDKYINLRDLHRFISTSFPSDVVKVTSTKASLRFSVGIDATNIRFVQDDWFGRYVSKPSVSGCLIIDDYTPVLSVALAASEEDYHSVKTSGVYVKIGAIAEFVATDQFVMGYSQMINMDHEPTTTLVPSSFFSYALKLYWDTSPMLRVTNGKCWLFTDRFFVLSPLINVPYPGDQIIVEMSKKEPSYMEVDTMLLIDKLGALVDVDYRGKNSTTPVSSVCFNFDDEKGMLVLSAKTADGSVEETVMHVPFSGRKGKWELNVYSVKKIINIVRTLLSSPKIRFHGHEKGWITITPSNMGSVIFATTPMSH